MYDNFIEVVDLVYGSSGRAFSIQKGSDHNKVYRNYCKNTKCQSQLSGGEYNEIFYNIFDTIDSDIVGYDGQAWSFAASDGVPVRYNKFYNNIIYNTSEKVLGLYYGTIRMWSNDTHGTCEYNEITNNIIFEPNNYAISIYPIDKYAKQHIQK